MPAGARDSLALCFGGLLETFWFHERAALVVSNNSLILLVIIATTVMADVVDILDSTGNSLFDNILTVCLYLGAAFQLICIFSVIILPEREDQDAETVATEKANGELQADGAVRPAKEQHTNSGLKNRRHEKKKKK